MHRKLLASYQKLAGVGGRSKTNWSAMQGNNAPVDDYISELKKAVPKRV